MGCPEWQDADFQGEVSSQFFPDWTRVDLKGFRRPRWFVQGPVPPCIAYLLAKRRGRRLRQSLLWWLLGGMNRTSKWARPAAWAWQALRVANRKASAAWRRLRRHYRGWKFLAGLALLALLAAARVLDARTAAALLLAMLSLRYVPWCVKRLRRLIAVKVFGRESAPAARFDVRVQKLIDEFARRFPHRPDQLTPDDFKGYSVSLWLWQ